MFRCVGRPARLGQRCFSRPERGAGSVAAHARALQDRPTWPPVKSWKPWSQQRRRDALRNLSRGRSLMRATVGIASRGGISAGSVSGLRVRFAVCWLLGIIGFSAARHFEGLGSFPKRAGSRCPDSWVRFGGGEPLFQKLEARYLAKNHYQLDAGDNC